MAILFKVAPPVTREKNLDSANLILKSIIYGQSAILHTVPLNYVILIIIILS